MAPQALAKFTASSLPSGPTPAGASLQHPQRSPSGPGSGRASRHARKASPAAAPSTDAAGEIVAVLHNIVERVLGSAVAADQPLMEVMQGFQTLLAVTLRSAHGHDISFLHVSLMVYLHEPQRPHDARSLQLCEWAFVLLTRVHKYGRLPHWLAQSRSCSSDTSWGQCFCRVQAVVYEQSGQFADLCCALQAGLDSLGAVELQNAMSRSLGVALPATVAFDYPTVSALAAFIAAQRQPQSHGYAPAQQASLCSYCGNLWLSVRVAFASLCRPCVMLSDEREVMATAAGHGQSSARRR